MAVLSRKILWEGKFLRSVLLKYQVRCNSSNCLEERDWESFEDAVHRELTEETGYRAGELHFLTDGPLSSGASAEILTVYVATGLIYVGIGERDETEDIEVIIVPLESLPERLDELRNNGNHIDLKTYGLVELAKNLVKNKKDNAREKNQS